MNKELRPNQAEKEFLTLAYNRFYDIFDEVFTDSFWDKDKLYRFTKSKDAFAIYAELLNYPPVKWVIEEMKQKRPPLEAEIGSELFKFIRNVLSHFSFFDSWDDVWINRSIINWHKEGQTIDTFLLKYQGKEPVKFRFWEATKRKMTYLSINFPSKYDSETRIFLKDFITEKEGVKFALLLMKRILDTQVEK
jgi:hypothetical protein